MARLTQAHKKRFLRASIAFASGVERVGVHRGPLLATAPEYAAARAHRQAAEELLGLLEPLNS